MSGFEASKRTGGSGSEGMVQPFAVNPGHASLLAPGDAVFVIGNANADGLAEVDAGNATTANSGVIVSVDFQLAGENLTETGLPAATAGTIKVNTDKHQTYEIESDATLVAGDVNLNCGINTTAATKSGGLTVSNMTLDAATKATTVTLPYRIVKLLPGKTSGVLGDRALVRPNATTEFAGAVGIS